MRAISDLGYEKPSPIQAQALPILLKEPTDFIGLATTGSGKTAAFAIPLLEKIDPNIKAVQAVILCPTRELALQVAGQIDLLGKHLKIKALPIYGGASYTDQIRGLRMGMQIVVGTPGRVVDHLNKGTLRLEHTKTIILDEADEMISMGFKDDMTAILEKIPKDTANTWLFSATMSPAVRGVAEEYLKNPQRVQVNRTEMLPSTIEQYFYKTQESDKPEVLCKLIDAAEDFYGLVFCQTKALVVDLAAYLHERGHLVDSLHGDKTQEARERTMKAFRERKVKLLICTDVASRGLDVKDITHVINYSLPRELDNYVHRIGRTARSGKTGIAMSLVTRSHWDLVLRIEKMTKSTMKEGIVPTQQDIAMKKMNSVLAKFQAVETAPRALQIMADSWKESLSAMSSEEIAARFISMMMPEMMKAEKVAQAPREYQRRESHERSGPREQGRRPEYRGGQERSQNRYGDRSGAPAFAPRADRQRPVKRFSGKTLPTHPQGAEAVEESVSQALGGNARPMRSAPRQPTNDTRPSSRPHTRVPKPLSEKSAQTESIEQRAKPFRPRPPSESTAPKTVATAEATGPNRRERRAQQFAERSQSKARAALY